MAKMITIEIEEGQLNDMAQALEFASRFVGGQIEEMHLPPVLLNSPRVFKWDNETAKLIHDKRSRLEAALFHIKNIIFPEYGARESSSIDHVDSNLSDFSASCYDMYRAIREHENKDAKEWNMYKNPRSATSKFTKPKVEKIN